MGDFRPFYVGYQIDAFLQKDPLKHILCSSWENFGVFFRGGGGHHVRLAQQLVTPQLYFSWNEYYRR